MRRGCSPARSPGRKACVPCVAMARPGLEPGTPRFSDDNANPSNPRETAMSKGSTAIGGRARGAASGLVVREELDRQPDEVVLELVEAVDSAAADLLGDELRDGEHEDPRHDVGQRRQIGLL